MCFVVEEKGFVAKVEALGQRAVLFSVWVDTDIHFSHEHTGTL